MLNRLFGFLLVIGVVLVGVKACDPDFSKTKVMITRASTCVQLCLRDNPTNECAWACPRRESAAAQAAIVIDDTPLTSKDTLAVVELRVKPCPPTIKQVSLKQRADFVKRFIAPTKVKPTVAVKKHYSKKNLSKTKAHAHKFIVSYHHKSKVSPPHHHHHHGGGGHHHSGPQKISAHGPPSHLTGCGP